VPVRPSTASPSPSSPAATPGRGGSYPPAGRGPARPMPNVTPAPTAPTTTPAGNGGGRRFGVGAPTEPGRPGGSDRPGSATRPGISPPVNGPRPAVYRPTVVQTPNGATIHRDPTGHTTIVRTGNTTIIHA